MSKKMKKIVTMMLATALMVTSIMPLTTQNVHAKAKAKSVTLFKGSRLAKSIKAGNIDGVYFTDKKAPKGKGKDFSAKRDHGVVAWIEFSSAEGWTSLYISTQRKGVKVKANKDSSSMFKNTNVYTIDFSNLDTSNVTNMKSMLEGCKKLNKVNLPYLNTAKVKNMSYMFKNCYSLKYLDFSYFNDTKTKTNNKGMFDNTIKLGKIRKGGFCQYSLKRLKCPKTSYWRHNETGRRYKPIVIPRYSTGIYTLVGRVA